MSDNIHNTFFRSVLINCFRTLSLIFIPLSSFSTHIVGGSLTYIYNGGSSYTVTLKLYRDCGSGSAAFPDPVTISVRGYNGASFSPSRDISIPLGTVSPVPSNLDTCADPPSPMPCVEEGIYTTTVTNLPPNPGGYHLYFQVCCRNGSVINCVSPLTTGGSFYAYIPGTSVVWLEDFTLANGTISDAGLTAWTRTLGTPAPTYARVETNRFEFSGNNDASATWTSQVIDISSYPAGVNVSVDLSENSGLEANDSIIVYYSLDGGTLTQFTANGAIADDFGSAIATVNTLIGANLQIFVYVHYDGASSGEIYRCDNVQVVANDFQANDNPQFTLFPPLFLCVGQPFTFDHSATDANGDSLVYSFYTPYDDIAPTFTNNQTNFTPITWVGGFSATNPLGGTPLNLNSATGLLSGAPTTIGQYVVGVMVKEYRNGICIDSTLRDFQFNVVNCPLPATAVLTDTIFACSGLSVTFSNLGDSATNNWWDFGDPAVTNDTSILASPTYTYSSAGYYTVTLITNKGTFCADTTSAIVFAGWVNAGFVSDTVKCAGDLFNFNDTSSSSSNMNINNWIWWFGDGDTVYAADTTHIYTTAGTYTVTHIVTTDMGCTDTVVKTVTVSPAPVFTVNMTGVPDSVWTSPSVVRDCKVCGATGVSMVCITFILTLDPGTQAISFDITDGAVPPGALYYQINCGDSNKVGDTICISGVGPHQITFCKPGNNTNEYTISAITAPEVSPAITVSDGCMDSISAIGYIESSVTWTSVAPGAQGTYDTYLDCPAGCDTVIVTAQPGYPPSVDYMVCGLPAGGGSCSMTPVCDTTTVYFVSTLATDINPLNPTICFGGSNTTITAVPTGGAMPYSYLWNTGETTASISVGVGTYYVTVTDTTDCEPVMDSVTVTAFASAITADAGPDQTVCNNYPDVTLSGIVTAASGGTWSNGSGTFSPSADSLNTIYTPTPAEASEDSMLLFLTTTGNGSCPADTDTMIVFFIPFSATASVSSSDALCFGDSSGTATATVSAGLSPITYLWNNGETTSAISNLPAATYTITVSESNGCDTIISITINEPDSFAATISDSSNVTCFGGNNGNATVSASGGTSPYSYLWNNSQTDSTATNLTADTFYVTVTDNKGCSTTTGMIITEPSELLVSISSANTTCYNDSDGTATVTPSGGTSPYTFLWSNSQTDSTATGLSAGTYFVTVMDFNNCTLFDSSLITEPDTIIMIISVSGPQCFPETASDFSFSVSGGTPPYTYTLISGDTLKSDTITFNCGLSVILGGPTFTLIIVDSLGCTGSVIGQSPPIPDGILLYPSVTNLNCNGDNSGSASVSATGGVSPYNFQWSNGSTLDLISNLSAGTYCVTVVDNNGCQDIDTCVVINEPQPVSVSINPTPVSCKGGNDGAANSFVTGGTTGYTYLWSNGDIGSSTGGLFAGNHSVTVTDFNGCTATGSTLINEPATVVTVSTSSTPVSCKSGSNGIAVANASGGNGSFTYSWSNGGTGATISNLTAGTYFVTATDFKGCSATTSVTVTEPATVVSVLSSSTDALCNGTCTGTLSSSASGGTGGFNFSWSSGCSSSFCNNICIGNYTVTATDANGCIATSSATVSEPTVLTAATTATNALCNDSCNGTLSASATGGTTNYSFSWSAGLGSGANKSNVCAGNYMVTATDANGCADTSSVVVSEPDVLFASATFTPVSCKNGNDGSATVTATGGTSPYSYLWNTNDSTDALQGVSSGIYSVTVTDNNGCTDTASVEVTEPATIVTVSATSTDVNCFGGNDGTATASASGGTPGYTYLWSTLQGFQTLAGLSAGNYSVTATDNNGCTATASALVDEPDSALNATTTSDSVSCKGGNDGSATVTAMGGTFPYSYLWNTNDSTDALQGVSSGIYSVTVTDANNCTFITSVNVEEPATLLSLDTSSTMVICNGDDDGTATVIASGGVPPYYYLWDVNANSQTTATAIGLVTGTYGITVTDNNGCVMDTVVFVDQPFSPLSITISTDSVKCFGGNDGSAVVTPSGGTPPYTYEWDDDNLQTDSTATGLTAGIYSVTVTDNTGNCKAGNNVVVNQPDSMMLALVSTNVSCFGGEDGFAAVIVDGGTAPYSYLWSNNSFQSQISNLKSQIYFVTVTDDNGCSDSAFVNISEPADALSFSNISTVNVLCNGDSTGEASVVVSGGTSPYSYLWNNSVQTQSIAFLQAGNYFITVTDSNNCTIDTSVTITEPSPSLTVSISATEVNCFGGDDGTATITPDGGTSPYFFQWDSLADSQTDSTATGLMTGTYSVTVTDNNGCILDTNSAVFVGQPATFISATTSQENVSCNGFSDASATVYASGGTSPFTYQWNDTNLQTDSVATGLSAGTYSITVTDNNICINDTIFVIITEPAQLLLNVDTFTNVFCKGDSNGTATVSPMGGTAPYSYLWNTGVQTQSIASVLAGNYTVTVTDSNGCVNPNGFFTILEPDDSLSLSVSFTDITCFGDSDGTAAAIPSGGWTPYSYQWSANANSQTDSIATGLKKGTYFVTVSDDKGCVDTAASITISEPAKLIVIASNNDTICPGATHEISANASGGTGSSYTYEWNQGLGTGQNQTVNPSSNTMYLVTATDENGCESAADTVIVFVRNLYFDSLNITVTPNDTICLGKTVTLKATYKEEFPPYTYIWDNGLGTGLEPKTDNPDETTIYTITVIDMCGDSISKSITIYVDTFPVIDILPVIPDCEPYTVSFQNSVQNPAGSTYLWKFGDGKTSADASPVHTYDKSGTYIVYLKITTPSPPGCALVDDTATTVIVRPAPKPACSATPLTATLKNPQISFTTGNFTSWLWDFGDEDTSSFREPVHTYLDSGDYFVTVTVTNKFGCENTCEVQVRINPDPPLGIPNAFTPNPNGPNGGMYSFDDFSNNVFFPITKYVIDFRMEIFNRWGELLFVSTDINIGWDGYYRNQMCQQDVYVWKIYLKWWDGSEWSNAGDLTLLR